MYSNSFLIIHLPFPNNDLCSTIIFLYQCFIYLKNHVFLKVRLWAFLLPFYSFDRMNNILCPNIFGYFNLWLSLEDIHYFTTVYFYELLAVLSFLTVYFKFLECLTIFQNNLYVGVHYFLTILPNYQQNQLATHGYDIQGPNKDIQTVCHLQRTHWGMFLVS